MPSHSLHRTLGLLDAVGIGFGAIVGAGIFVVLGVAAGIAGPAIVPALGIAGLAATANALSSAQLAAAYPQAGGAYEYGYQVLTPWAGFAAGWMFLASKLAAAGTVALGLAGYLDVLLPGMPPRLLAVGAVVVFTALNYAGIRRSSTANLVIVTISVGSLLLLAGVGLPRVEAQAFQPLMPFGWGSLFQAAAILFFAFTGYARIATLAEEVREPARTIPRAVVITISGAILLYLLVAIVAVGVAGGPTLAASSAPLHEVARLVAPGAIATLVAAGGIIAMLGVMLSQLLGLSRMTFAMARNGDLPRSLSAVHAASGVPRRAVLGIGGVAAIIAATGSLSAVASAAAFTILLYYGIANVAALRMPKPLRRYPDWIPVFGLLACAVLALSLDQRTILTGVMVLGVGAGLRWVVRGKR
jgi:basic amino acid/polyamine antiporter, APA family